MKCKFISVLFLRRNAYENFRWNCGNLRSTEMFGMHLTHSYYVSRCCFLMRKLNTFLLLFYINLRFFQRIGVAPEPDSTEDSFGPDPVCVRSASSPVRRCSHPVTGSPRDALEAATRRSSEGKNKFLRFPGSFYLMFYQPRFSVLTFRPFF